jgi:hypothetical protein
VSWLGRARILSSTAGPRSARSAIPGSRTVACQPGHYPNSTAISCNDSPAFQRRQMSPKIEASSFSKLCPEGMANAYHSAPVSRSRAVPKTGPDFYAQRPANSSGWFAGNPEGITSIIPVDAYFQRSTVIAMFGSNHDVIPLDFWMLCKEGGAELQAEFAICSGRLD